MKRLRFRAYKKLGIRVWRVLQYVNIGAMREHHSLLVIPNPVCGVGAFGWRRKGWGLAGSGILRFCESGGLQIWV